jgi:predicted DNA-binding ribbon-helix-helix protein
MARQTKPKVEDVAKVIKNVDLSVLKSNRFTGNSITKIEHCLIEVLAEITQEQQYFKNHISELVEDCLNTNNLTSFLRSFSAMTRVQVDHRRKFSNFSVIGIFFDALMEKLISVEEKQAEIGKSNSVKHARLVAELINKQLKTCDVDAQHQNEKVDVLWNHYFSKEQQALMLDIKESEQSCQILS